MQGPAEKTSLELHKLKIWFGVGRNIPTSRDATYVISF